MNLLKSVILAFILNLVAINNAGAQGFCRNELLLKETNYLLDLRVDYEKKKLFGKCTLTFTNNSDKLINNVPLLLYRLLKASSLKDMNGNKLNYTQRIVPMEDWEEYHVNFIEVKLPEPLQPNSLFTLNIDYEGFLFGYTETSNGYVHDKIDPEFTIIRPDCRAYPELGFPCEMVNRKSGFVPSFNYEISIEVPESLIVVNGGELKELQKNNGYSKYTYLNTQLAWRIDIAIGKYKVIETDHLRLFYLERDSIGAKTVHKFALRTFELYTKWWGDLKEQKKLSVIEVPSGYGSQADVTAILQTADAFNDSTQMRQLYHEISHLWNTSSKDQHYSRWNEGLATFIEYLTIEKLEHRLYLDYATEWYLKYLQKELKENKKLRETALINFGKEEITDHSYSVGMIMFCVLYKVMGEDNFNKLIGSYYNKYFKEGGTTDEFAELANQISQKNISVFFNEWIYSTKYNEYIINGLTIEEISALYD